MKPIDPATAAAELRALADAIAAGSAPMPAIRHVQVNGHRLLVVPRAIHNLLCRQRFAVGQGTEPDVLGCADCGLCYPAERVDPTGMTTGVAVHEPSRTGRG